jgi:hypothetical protein
MIKIFIVLIISTIANAVGPSPYKYHISGDGFKKLAKHQMDMPADGSYRFTNIKPRSVKKGDAIFVKPDRMDGFAKNYKNFRRVMEPFILITHNSDTSMPGAWAHLLDDPKLIAWLATNPDRLHPKLICIPSGLSNTTLQGNSNKEKLITNAWESQIGTTRKYLIYINLSSSTNISRSGAINTLKKGINNKKILFSKRKAFEDYLMDISQSEFILSPPGNGLDCHRTWEALYMGAIPIVISSTLDPVFKDLPVVIVDSWNQITEQFLLEKKEEFSKRKFNINKLYMPYWEELIEILGNNEI